MDGIHSSVVTPTLIHVNIMRRRLTMKPHCWHEMNRFDEAGHHDISQLSSEYIVYYSRLVGNQYCMTIALII